MEVSEFGGIHGGTTSKQQRRNLKLKREKTHQAEVSQSKGGVHAMHV